jgi:hypothetical protein
MLKHRINKPGAGGDRRSKDFKEHKHRQVCTRCGKPQELLVYKNTHRKINPIFQPLTNAVTETYKGIKVCIRLCDKCAAIIIKAYLDECFIKGIITLELEIDKLTQHGQSNGNSAKYS